MISDGFILEVEAKLALLTMFCFWTVSSVLSTFILLLSLSLCGDPAESKQ
jgi:hypothetical protein